MPIPTSTLNDFVVHCKANIASAKSHLADERKREEEANTERELQRLASEAQRKEEALRLELQKEEERRKQEEMDRRVRMSKLQFYTGLIDHPFTHPLCAILGRGQDEASRTTSS